jgi:non-ribosomal peptide synthetase component E (peptide arylation enzyme)
VTAIPTDRPPLTDVVTSAARRRHYERAGLWDATTLPGEVARHAGSRPGATAVIDEAGTHTYVELADDAAVLAAALAERGVGAGAVVSVQLPNRYETVVAAVATLSLGAVINPLLPNYRLHELTHVFRTVRPAVVFTPGEHRGFDHRALIADVVAASGVHVAHVVVGDDPGPGGIGFTELLQSPSAVARPSRAEHTASAVSEVIFTSGTEAQPKAIMHTEQTTNFSVRVAHRDLGMGPHDVVWMPSPIGHSTGFNYGVRFALYHGLPLVLQDRWDGDAAAALVAGHRCSYTLAATTFLQDLIAAATRAGTDLSSLRYFGCGGAPVPPHLVDLAAEHGVQVLRLYGSTEVLVASWNRPSSSAHRRRETDGVAMSDVELVVRGEDGTDLPPGTEGELWTRGPNTCVGFFADPQRTSETFDADGWVRSGDLVVLDDDGFVTVVGRRKEIIIRGGVNIAPREIEELLVAFPEVQRAAVVGIPDERLGETMCACLVLEPDASIDFDTMVARLSETGLATYKLPQRLELLTTLPTTASGKVQKHVIVSSLVGGDAHPTATRS